MATFQLDVVTPERKVFSDQVTMVSLKGVEGDLGIMANHMPLVTPLKIGPVKITREGQPDEWIAVSGGFVEVRGSQATILAESAELAEEIDIERATKAKERAEERIKKLKKEEFDFRRAELSLQRAIVRLQVGRLNKNK